MSTLRDPVRSAIEKLKAVNNGQAEAEIRLLEEWLHAHEKEREHQEHRSGELLRDLSGARHALSELNKLQSEFVSICAHDLRSPTNSILSFIEILLDDGEHMPARERAAILERMARAGRHMLDLISDLLDMVQIESGKYRLQPEPLLLSQLGHESLIALKGSFDNKEIKASLTVGTGELKVKLDHQKGLQILNNLLSNALKFTPRGGSVEILIENRGRMVELEVRDSGPGIPEAELPKMFEKFTKLSTQATEGEKSTGLGLTIVKQLLDLHKGEIRVKSKVGAGTSFFVLLPIAESPELLKLFSGKRNAR